MAETYHWFSISQGKGENLKWIIIGLREAPNKTEGQWYSDESDVSDVGKKMAIGPGTHRRHLFWRWDSSTFELKLGSKWKDESHKGGPDIIDTYLTLMNVRRSANKRFIGSGRGQLVAPGDHLARGEIAWEVAAPRLYTVGG